MEADVLRCRRGYMPKADGPLVWLHGASAGEMRAATVLAALLREGGFRFTAAYTSTNHAGVELARRANGDTIATFAPWDHPRWLGRAFDSWKPSALFLVETELWPGLIDAATRRGVPVFCVSARVYERDVFRYRLGGRLVVPMLRRVTAVLAQDETEMRRLVAIGADPARCTVAGNLKFASSDAGPVDRAGWRRELGLGAGEPIVTVGSVHDDEVEFLFQALDLLPKGFARFIVAPRHRSGGDLVIRAAQRRQWRVRKRTDASGPADWQILLLDSMGELGSAYSVASLAVVGGGFRKHGGHNLLEPVAVGVPTIFGKHFHRFERESLALRRAVPAAQVSEAGQLAQRIREWLGVSEERGRILEAQRRSIPDGDAIAHRYLTALSPWLERHL